MRRLLSYLFMALAFMFLAVPVFAQGGKLPARSTGSPSRPDFPWRLLPRFAAWHRAEPRPPQPRRWAAIQPRAGYSVRTYSWPGSDRVTGALYAGHHLCQSEVAGCSNEKLKSLCA